MKVQDRYKNQELKLKAEYISNVIENEDTTDENDDKGNHISREGEKYRKASKPCTITDHTSMRESGASSCTHTVTTVTEHSSKSHSSPQSSL